MEEKKTTKKWLKILKNKYVIATLAFLVLMFLFDDFGFLTTIRLRKNLDKLEDQKAEMLESIKQDSVAIVKMQNDIKEIERFGRENYYMKRDNEDIFIIKRNDED